MTETYTSGVWTVKPSPGKHRNWCPAPWESFDAQNGWKQQPEFQERIMRVRSHCEDFQPSTLELVTQVE